MAEREELLISLGSRRRHPRSADVWSAAHHRQRPATRKVTKAQTVMGDR